MRLRAMLLAALLTFVGSGAARPSADPQAIPSPPSTTQIVLLGTGNRDQHAWEKLRPIDQQLKMVAFTPRENCAGHVSAP